MVQKMMYVEFTQVAKQEDAKHVSKNRQTMSLYLHLRFYGFPAQSPTQSRESVNCRHNTYCSYVPLMTHTVLRLIYQTDIQDPYSVPRCWGRQSSVSATVDLPPRSRRRCVVVRRRSFVRSFVRCGRCGRRQRRRRRRRWCSAVFEVAAVAVAAVVVGATVVFAVVFAVGGRGFFRRCCG